MNSQPNRTEHATEPTDRPTETERPGIIGSISATADQGRRSTDGEHLRRAAVILGGMYQFVALLNPQGDILEVNRAALEGAGHRIEEIRGKPFWTARWWQVSEKIREELKAAIRRAAAGEFVRYEVQIYGEKAGLIPITIDFSLQPIGSESGEVEYLLAEGRNITERKRAEEEVARQSQELRALNERLKELDRLKTQFFANVSHEFRTLLALMLGPLEEVLREGRAGLSPEHHEQLVTARRNAFRLLKLVNTLLDFSRIEAGRMQAVYEPTDLAVITSEIAGVFRSAMENGGLRFSVECQPIPEPVYVDREMWEKVVLNLLSNAFKFTFEGEVAVTLKPVDGVVEFQVRDTGVGIPEDQRGRVFERFHRIEGTHARTYEGTGIGLALVQELVKLHGGNVRVESALGQGSTFTVTLPRGREHLPAERIQAGRSLASTAVAAEAYAEEALRWLPDESGAAAHAAAVPKPASLAPSPRSEPAAKRELIVVADDNADMRQYLKRLLDDSYEVQPVADGREALETTRRLRPSLVLADVMMPQLDGFGLLRAIRGDAALASMPVILVSARAGEESRVEGLQAGADDYLVKPFAARELLARVEAHLKMSNLRRETAEREERLRNEAELERQKLRAVEERLAESNCLYRELQNREAKVRRLVDANIVGVLIWDLDGRILEANDAFLHMVGYQREDLLSGRLRWKDLTPPEWLERDERLWVPQLKITGSLQPFEKEFFRKDHSRVPVLIGGALFEAGGSEGVAFVLDLTERKQAEEGLRRTEKELRDLVENMPAMAGVLLPDGSHPYLTNQWQEYTGLSVAKTDSEGWRRVVHPEDTDLYAQKFRAAAAARKPFDNELRLRRAADGEYRWFLVRISPLCDGRGNIVKWHGVMTDIQDRKRAEEATRRSEKELRDVLEQVPGMVFAVVEDGRYGRYSYVSTQWYDYTGLSEAETINGGWQNAIHSEDTEQHMKKYQTAVAEGQPFESEVRLRRAADGQYRWFLIRVTPLRDEAGNVVKWYGFISDIEDRKRAEQERERLRKLEAELVHMNRVSIMGELTASIAHEINQPLTVVVSNANACARMLSTASPDLDEVRLAVGDIADYGRRASEVLARIRGQLKKSASAKSSLNIGDVIVEVLPLLRGELEKRRTKLDTHLQSDLPLVLGDRIELQQVLINLLMNGIESMTSIMDRPRVLTVQSRVVESGEVEVAVRDCGVGISVNQMRSLFDPFFTTKPGGMGMGLPICRSIIEAHGGKLWASSNANCGATFQFTLPAA